MIISERRKFVNHYNGSVNLYEITFAEYLCWYFTLNSINNLTVNHLRNVDFAHDSVSEHFASNYNVLFDFIKENSSEMIKLKEYKFNDEVIHIFMVKHREFEVQSIYYYNTKMEAA